MLFSRVKRDIPSHTFPALNARWKRIILEVVTNILQLDGSSAQCSASVRSRIFTDHVILPRQLKLNSAPSQLPLSLLLWFKGKQKASKAMRLQVERLDTQSLRQKRAKELLHLKNLSWSNRQPYARSIGHHILLRRAFLINFIQIGFNCKN